jgi:Ca-activated chloride channel family protein
LAFTRRFADGVTDFVVEALGMMGEWMISDFHFLRPWWLLLLLPAWLLLKLWLNNTSREDGWQQSCDPELLQAMQIQTASKGSRWSWLYWPVVTLMILAIAGPAVRQVPVPVVKNQSALIIALDVSKSMLSDDLKPSRLQRAKFKIQDLLESRQDGQTALVVYSGDAFVVTPLTDDTETITALLDVIDPSIMPVSGTNTIAALDKAEELLNQAGIARGQILLVTDGIKMFRAEDRIAALLEAGINTHVLAVGTAEGAPIPTSQGFLKDLTGKIVIPQVNYQELQQAAKTGQGKFSVLTNSINEDTLYETSANQDDGQDKEKEEQQGSTRFIDDGPWLALLVIPMLALLYRRGLLMMLCLGFMLNTHQAHAWSWDDLWLNEDQQAWNQLEEAPEQAFEQAQNQQLKAAAAYKKGDFKAASQLYPEQGQSLADHYNRGNALAQSGDYEAALQSYEQALTYDPQDADTLYNKQVVEQALQQQQQQQQQQDQQNQDSESGDSEEQNAEQQQQSSSEQEQQEQQQQAQKDQQSEQSQADSEQSEEQQEQQQQVSEQQAEESEEPAEEIELTPEEMALDAEEKQAMEQWLRRVKDDPGGLMRRKFLYQYHKRNQDGESYDNQTTEDW